MVRLAKYDIRPDLITSAKGLSSAYASIGAVIATDQVFEPFIEAQSMYTHGITFGGHPVQCAIALKNIEIMKRERIVENVRENGDAFRETLAQLLDLDIVGDLRGTGFFYALELVKDKETREGVQRRGVSETLLRGFLSPALFDRGLICRADDRGDPVIQISPPLIATQAQFDEMTGILGDVLTEAQERMHVHHRPVAARRPRARDADSVRVLVVGTGGVGSAVAPIAARRDFFERIVFADIDRASRSRSSSGSLTHASARPSSTRPTPTRSPRSRAPSAPTRSSTRPTRASTRRSSQAAFDAGCTYLDMAMTLSDARRTKLGDVQFAQDAAWRERGLLALVGIGVEPGLSDVFARYAADHLFSEIDEIGVRDGADLVVDGYAFAPTFSIWTTIEECLNPPVDLGARPRLVHDRAVLGAGGVRLPGGHRPDRVRERRARGGAADPALDRLQTASRSSTASATSSSTS